MYQVLLFKFRCHLCKGSMGYINTVNQTAEASIASSIRVVQNTESYKDRNGVVSQCYLNIVIRHVSKYTP